VNLFATSPDPVESARALADQHLVKMSLECCQILAAALDGRAVVRKADGQPYRVTHRNHPCVRWAAESDANAGWVWWHGFAMVQEYWRRRGVELGVMWALGHEDLTQLLWDETPPASFVAVVPPDVAALGIPVHWSYRETLRRKYRAWSSTSRPGPARYTNAEPPEWLGDVPVVRA
jgi:hypothetical protein